MWIDEGINLCQFFGVFPPGIHLSKSKWFQVFAGFFSFAFNIFKTRFEFAVGFFKRIIRIDVIESGVIDERKADRQVRFRVLRWLSQF